MAAELPAGLVERLAANLRNQSKDVLPAVHSRPVSDYLDPDLYARELQKLYHDNAVRWIPDVVGK